MTSPKERTRRYSIEGPPDILPTTLDRERALRQENDVGAGSSDVEIARP
jgi:hypothetical protein